MSCGSNCACAPKKEVKPLNSTKVKKIIAILSGKGGVGKSLTTSLLAIKLARNNKKVGIIDADILGPSIPRMFGLEESSIYGDEMGVYPVVSKKLGIKIVSINMMMGDEQEPALWRGPIITNMLNQFYRDVYWEELDYLLIDMPPGTGDTALTIFKDIPVDEIIMVTTPSKLVNMIVGKAINMAKTLEIPIKGIIENMAYIKDTNQNLYAASSSETLAAYHDLEIIETIPLDRDLALYSDNGNLEELEFNYLDFLVKNFGE